MGSFGVGEQDTTLVESGEMPRADDSDATDSRRGKVNPCRNAVRVRVGRDDPVCGRRVFNRTVP